MLKPTSDNVLIQKVVEERVESGIVLPDNAPNSPIQKGKVAAMGPGAKDQNQPIFNVGDVVLYTQYSPQEVKNDGDTFLIMKFADILAVVESAPVAAV